MADDYFNGYEFPTDAPAAPGAPQTPEEIKAWQQQFWLPKIATGGYIPPEYDNPEAMAALGQTEAYNQRMQYLEGVGAQRVQTLMDRKAESANPFSNPMFLVGSLAAGAGLGSAIFGGAGAASTAPALAAPAAAPAAALPAAALPAAAVPAAALPAAIPAGAATPGIFGGAGALGAAGVAAPNVLGTLTNAVAPSAAMPPGGQGNWWQQILGNLGGGKDAGLLNNIFAGVSGLAGLSGLAGGNDLSDAFGLTDTKLDPLKDRFADFAGTQLDQAGANNQGNILELLRKQAQPYEQKAFNSINNNLFTRGRLGLEDSATGEAYNQFAKGQSEADLMRQLTSYGLSDQLQTSAYNRASGSAGNAVDLRLGGGQVSPMVDFFNQVFKRGG